MCRAFECIVFVFDTGLDRIGHKIKQRTRRLLPVPIQTPVSTVFFPELTVTLALAAIVFSLLFAFLPRLGFRAQLDLGGLPFHVGQHKFGLTEAAVNEVFL